VRPDPEFTVTAAKTGPGAITISDHSSLLALFQTKLGYEGALPPLPPLPLRLSAYFGEM
jgi:hypothetical protein